MTTVRHAMVIDDDTDILSLLETQLARSLQMTVKTFALGRAALDSLFDPTTTLPDIIVIDLLLPDISGFEVVTALRRHERTKNVALLVVSAKAGLDEHARAEEVGADAFLEKPFKTRQFSDVIEGILAARSK